MSTVVLGQEPCFIGWWLLGAPFYFALRGIIVICHLCSTWNTSTTVRADCLLLGICGIAFIVEIYKEISILQPC